MKITKAVAIFAIGIALLFVPSSLFAQAATGTPPYATFQPGAFDSINLQDVNVNFAIPILHSRGRGMNLDFNLVYNSSFWLQHSGTWVPSSFLYPSGSPIGLTTTGPMGHGGHTTTSGSCMVWVPPVGRTMGFWKTEFYTTYGNYYFTDANGTVHLFPITWFNDSAAPDCGLGGFSGPYAASSSDGSGILYDPTSDSVTYPSGAKQVGTSISGSNTLYDPNGNYISSGGTWTDTAGRSALVVTPGSSSTTYQLYDPTGAYQTITVLYQSYNIKTNFGCSGVSEYFATASLPYEIDLPNTKKYLITYETTPAHTGYTTGRIQRITLPTGGYYEYDYGATNDGISCTDGSTASMSRVVNDGTTSNTWTYARAASGTSMITTVTEPMMPYDTAANQSTYTFNSSGQETQEKHYQGTATGTPLRLINSTFATNGSPATRVTVLPDTSQQSEVDTTYDNNGNLTKVMEYDWLPSPTGSPGTLVRETDMTYAASAPFVVTQQLIKNGSGTVVFREDLAYDGTTPSCVTGVAQHDDVHYGCSYNTRGNLTSITTYTDPVTPGGSITKSFTYDVFGNLLTAQLNCCQQKQFNYSATTNYTFPDSVVSGSGTPSLTVDATYNAYTGDIVTYTDENGQITTFNYDVYRRLVAVIRPDGTHLTTGYDDTNLIVTSTVPLDSSHSANQLVKYDGISRPLTTTLEDATGTVYSIVQTQYDPIGRAYKSSNPYTVSASYWTETRFDAIRRALKTILPDSSSATASFSGNCTTSADAVGNARKSCSDGLGRTTSVFEDPGTTGHLNFETDYTYNLLDELTGVTQAPQSRSYSYDALGRLTQSITPEAGTVCIGTVITGVCQQNGYNSFDLMTTKTDARGVVTSYAYDVLNRLTNVAYNVTGTGVTSTPAVTYTYGTTPSSYNNGRLTDMTDGFGTNSETYSYDILGRMTQLSKTIGSATYQTGYAYNLASELTQITYPSGRVVQQGHDAIGRLCAVAATVTTCSSTTTPYASGFGFNTAQQLTGFNYGNGVTASYGYSPDRLQMTSLSYANSSSTLFSLTYSYGSSGSNNGMIAGITDSVQSGRTASYSYDALSRITSASTVGSTAYPAWALNWTYDRYGNRTSQVPPAPPPVLCTFGCPTDSLGINTATNQITNPGFTYDASGNITSDGYNAMIYDAENRTVSANNGSTSGAYAYDGNGLRVQKSVPASSPTTTTIYIFSGSKVIAEYDNGAAPGSPSREYLYAGNGLLATITSAGTNYHHGDHLSPRLTTDSSGNSAGEQGHFPYGEAWYSASTTTKYQFTTYERDAESGNDYAMARFHENRLGRFSSPDPLAGSIDNPQSLNRYTYALNNPLSLIDPTGRDCWYYDDDGNVTSIDSRSSPKECGEGGDGEWHDPMEIEITVFAGSGGGDNSGSQGSQSGTGGGPGDGGIGGGSGGGAPSATTCSQSTGPSKIYNASVTTSALTTFIGGAIGGLVGPEGAVVGAAIGNTIGVGVNVSYVPSTKSWYVGPTAVVSPAGGSGIGVNYVNVPSTQNPNSIANHLSYSLTYQPLGFAGATVVKSPGSGPPVVGPSGGTRSPVAVGVSYNFCIRSCGKC